jgi:hypothetical protein
MERALLTVEYASAEQLLERLFALSQALVNDISHLTV